MIHGMWAGNSSHLLRQYESLAIGPSQQPVGFGVADARFGLGIEAQGMAGAVGDVAQVAQTRALVAFLNVGIGPAAFLDAIDEIPQVRPFETHALVGGFNAILDMPAAIV